ncbi:AAA family ATPase [Trichoderma compactum]
MEALQAYLLDVNSKKEARKPIVPIVQLVHRVFRQVKRSKSEQLYLDQPLWLGGATSSREAFAGNLPLRNISSYLSKHPEVCCIIYRDYDITSFIEKDTPDEDLDTRIGQELIEEFIEPVTTSLTTAVANFFDYYKFDTKAVADSNPSNLIAPYVAVYHAWKDDLASFMETLERRQRAQFDVVLDYVLSLYGDEYSLVDEMISKGKITQAYIEYLFKPGDIIVHGKDQEARGYLCKSWLWKDAKKSRAVHQETPNEDNNNSIFEVTAWSWNFDGEFSKEESVLHIEFDANDYYLEKNIAGLSIRPFRFVDKDTKTRLKTRGEWFWKCRERRMISYDGAPQGLRHSSGERYMVDMVMYRDLHEFEYISRKHASWRQVNEAMKQEDPPDEAFIYLAPPTIKGFNLKRKKWVDLKLDGLREVSWNTRAFESLVLNKKTKRLIQALISNQIEAEKSTDLISGKGNGLIMLLHGGPGTGKTLTAESVAEIAKKPLYPVTCGDIGTKPEAVESYLESVLHLGKTWGCVVLLDEADVFLEQRSLEDLHRNALVSVFLRVLEYYDGILILTSNRVGTFDEAFKSRIQLAVHYSNLTIHQRTKVWENFIGRLKELNEEGIDFDDLEDKVPELAIKEMNGREIRNAITTARQYARWERQQDQGFKLNFEVMKEVIETAGEFDEYIKTLNDGFTQEQLAKQDGIR